MLKKTVIVLLLLAISATSLNAQETVFGKNKVRYKDFDWSFIQTRHFDIHFYEDSYPTAKFSSAVLESSYVEISRELTYKIQKRIPVFLYNSHNDFQQTNIIPNLISEGVGGFTEAFKNRIVIPFTGSYEDLRHVLHHELTHAVIYDMIYGNVFSSLISRQRLFSLPLWYAEGYAEYSSRHGWDYFADMFVRDAAINNYMAPPERLGGFLAYKQGQAMVKYIAEKYGEEKLGEILRKGRIHLTMNKALHEAIGVTQEEFWKAFSKEMKRRYWPEIAARDEVADIAKQITHGGKDGSFFNEKPEFSPDGENLAIFTDKSDYTEIVLISAENGKTIKRMVKSQRSGDLESLHAYVSGISFSPDGTKLVFAAKSEGKEALFFYDLEDNKVYLKKRFNYYNIVSPQWSPDGKQIVFSALNGYMRDLFVYHLDSDAIQQLISDRYDDLSPTWLADSKGLLFSSDRPHASYPVYENEKHLYVNEGAYKPGGFGYGNYNIFRIDLDQYAITPIEAGPGDNKFPRASPDGKKFAFVSNRNGVDNLYVAYLDTTRFFALTDILTGIQSISWSPDGERIAFSAFSKGVFDIFILNDLVPAGDMGLLTLTDFMLGKYDLLKKSQAQTVVSAHKDGIRTMAKDSSSGDLADDYLSYRTEPEDYLAVLDSTAVDSSQSDSVSTEETDSLVTVTGIYDDEYVFVGPEKPNLLDSLMTDLSDDTSAFFTVLEEPASFDSIPPLQSDGEFRIKKYKVKFTPDYVGGGFSYDTFFGLRGQSYFVFSDYLGNHQIYLATDLVNTIDQSNLQIYYFYNRMRTRVGVGLFHTKNFYIDNNNFLFSDRFYGFQALASRPFSIFSRIELFLSHFFIERQYYDFADTRPDRSSKVATANLSYVSDNIIWGITGPVNGRRAKIMLTKGINLFDPDDISFSSVELDYRKYWHFKKTFSMAFRLSGGASFGATPKLYFLGGTTNWIGNRTLDAKVYEVENLYFSDVVTPLRGIQYYGINGNRFGLVNWEFRFPMIEYFAMRYPLPLVISRVVGAVFIDMGAAWTGSNFKGGRTDGGINRLQDVKTGFGFGMRANFGFLVLRYDLAWSTNFYTVSDKPSHYFSLGADF